MEQAHYLLNRLRANNDSIRTKAPSPEDLDPNSVNALRMQAVQTTFNASAALDSVSGFQNQTALRQFSQSTTRHADLVRQADELRVRLYQGQLALGNLKGQQDRLKALQTAAGPQIQASGSAPDPITQQLADLAGQITALDAQNTATSNQITTLTTLAGSTPTLPDLTKVDAPGTLSAPDRLLKDAVTKLLSKTADSFTPKVQSSIALDNFLQMQYEILAKQLTSLRDEVGPGHRILFMEMPTSIDSADRKIIGQGGEDQLAQSWWRVSQIFRRYKTEGSPCWAGPNYNGMAYGDAALGTPDRSGGSENTKGKKPAGSDITVASFLQSPPPPPSPAASGDLPTPLKDADQQMHEAYKKIEDLVASLQKLDLTSDQIESHSAELASTRSSLRFARARLSAAFEEFLATIRPQKEQPFERKDQLLQSFESGCRTTKAEAQLAADQIDDLQQLLASRLKAATAKKDKSEIERLTKFEAYLKDLRQTQGRRLADLVTIDQARIYQQLGGPSQINQAFYSEIGNQRELRTRPVGAGEVRAVDLIPRQTALNVNTSHASVRDIGLSWAWHNLLGFGLKVDYQQQRETYDQFMQQEAFASSFGKGQDTFGWTFGPLPGTRVLNSGTRNTYAVLLVPDDVTALEIEGIGCAFNRKHDPPRIDPLESDRERQEYHCGNWMHERIEAPDRTNDGGFFVTSVDYHAVPAGSSATLLVRGSYFSPQTTVLVNGRRLPAVLGIGKPAQNLDDGPGDNAADDSAITGTFENVNQSQLALRLNIPAKYDGPDFPVITLVAPARAIILNQLPLMVNGVSYLRLDDQSLLKKPDTPEPKITLSGWQYLGPAGPANFMAHLNGQKLNEHLKEVRFAGVICPAIEKISESLVQVTCVNSPLPDWEFIAVSDDARPAVASLVVPNPLRLALSSYSVLDGVEFGKDLHPSLIPVKLSGSGFTTGTMLRTNGPDTGRIVLSYVSGSELRCLIRDPKPEEVLTLTDPLRQNTVSIVVKRPADKTADAAPKETTVTTVATEKKVVKQ
jgi:hypothetical protein